MPVRGIGENVVAILFTCLGPVKGSLHLRPLSRVSWDEPAALLRSLGLLRGKAASGAGRGTIARLPSLAIHMRCGGKRKLNKTRQAPSWRLACRRAPPKEKPRFFQFYAGFRLEWSPHKRNSAIIGLYVF